jgi:carbonic anhydrase
MKRLALLALAAGSTVLSTGCATPAYTARERQAMITRNWDYEIKQASDDWDHILLLRPASRLTIWNVR